MTEAVTIEASTLSVLNDQMWRRLGVTQTFDRLLIEAAARSPGPIAGVREAAGRTLQGGAAKFYEMTFPQIQRDLIKRSLLAEKGGHLSLDPAFAERVRRMVHDHSSGASRVQPTPGVTIESIEESKEKRAEREKAQKALTRKAPADKAAKAEEARELQGRRRRAAGRPERGRGRAAAPHLGERPLHVAAREQAARVSGYGLTQRRAARLAARARGQRPAALLGRLRGRGADPTERDHGRAALEGP